MTAKLRLDELLVKRGLFDDAHAARAAVLAGEVVVGEHRETSAGKRLAEDVPVRLKAKKEKDRMGFASRGGGKLAAALSQFSFDPAGLRCADLGCSTGGFTDCLLQNGAAKVSAVDVGRAEFDWRLRNDPRVALFERTNVRGIDVERIGGPFDLVVADLSFIRLEQVLDDMHRLLADGGAIISLVKPQFEVAKADVGAHGVVADPALHVQVLQKLVSVFPSHGLRPCAVAYSPVRGPKGNIEFLLLAMRTAESAVRGSSIDDAKIRTVVRQAHEALGG